MKKEDLIHQEDLRNANFLIKELSAYSDRHSNELRAILQSFIYNPKQDIRKLLNEMETVPEVGYCFLYDMDINMALSELEYPAIEEDHPLYYEQKA